MSMAAEASEICEATAAVDATALGERLQRADLLPVGLAGTLVMRQPVELEDLVVETTLLTSTDRPLVALHGEGLHVVTGDVPLLGDHLGAAELADLLGAETSDPAG